MSGKAAKIVLTERQESVLQQIHRSRTSPQRLVQRVHIILLACAGLLNVDIASKVALSRKQVGLWRRRWQQSFEALIAIECRETQAELSRAIGDILSDAPRSGSTGTFTAEQVTQILAVACEPPEQSGRPVDRWTHRELADDIDAQLNSPIRARKNSPGDSQQVVLGIRFAGGSAKNERRFDLGLWAA